MGESVAEGIVAHWIKAVGDPVKEGETVVEVTTDKVDVEVPSPVTGRLAEIVAEEGATVGIGATLARVAVETVPGGDGAAPSPEPPALAAPPSRATPEPTAMGATPTASPLARRAAAIRGIDLA